MRIVYALIVVTLFAMYYDALKPDGLTPVREPRGCHLPESTYVEGMETLEHGNDGTLALAVYIDGSGFVRCVR